MIIKHGLTTYKGNVLVNRTIQPMFYQVETIRRLNWTDVKEQIRDYHKGAKVEFIEEFKRVD